MESASSILRVPPSIRTVRPPPVRRVEVPPGAELPWLDPKDGDEKQLQEVWTVGVKVFDLSDAAQLEEYQQVMQEVTDGEAVVGEHRTEFNPKTGSFIALLRWARITCKLPSKR